MFQLVPLSNKINEAKLVTIFSSIMKSKLQLHVNLWVNINVLCFLMYSKPHRYMWFYITGLEAIYSCSVWVRWILVDSSLFVLQATLAWKELKALQRQHVIALVYALFGSPLFTVFHCLPSIAVQINVCEWTQRPPSGDHAETEYLW